MKKKLPKITAFQECSYCGNGIGVFTYQSPVIPGQYCTADCYSNAVIDYMDWQRTLKGRFKYMTDGHRGAVLVPILGS